MPLHMAYSSPLNKDDAFTTYADAPASQAAVPFNENALLLTLHSVDKSYIISLLERKKKNESGA